MNSPKSQAVEEERAKEVDTRVTGIEIEKKSGKRKSKSKEQE